MKDPKHNGVQRELSMSRVWLEQEAQPAASGRERVACWGGVHHWIMLGTAELAQVLSPMTHLSGLSWWQALPAGV